MKARHVRPNRRFWDTLTSEHGEYGDQRGHGGRRWSVAEPVWGDWSVPSRPAGTNSLYYK